MTPGEKILFEARMRREMKGLEDKAMRAEGLSPTRRRKRSKYTPLLGILLVMAFSIALMYLGMRLILKVAP
jgi:type VI protein secretion system component VasF